jgi:hypothetical protein
MSNVIDFLERIGQDADLRYAADNRLEQALANANIEPELRMAIANGDQSKIETLLGAKANVCAIVFPAEDDRVVEERPSVSSLG